MTKILNKPLSKTLGFRVTGMFSIGFLHGPDLGTTKLQAVHAEDGGEQRKRLENSAASLFWPHTARYVALQAPSVTRASDLSEEPC